MKGDFCDKRECGDDCPLWDVENCANVCEELHLNGYDLVKLEEKEK